MQETKQKVYRRAALTLHELAELDREKVLSRLDPAWRQSLMPMLDELTALGIPQGRKWASSSEELPSNQNRNEVSKSASIDFLTVLDSLSARDAALILREQSQETIVLILHIASWSWKADALDLLEGKQGDEVREKLSVYHSLPPKLVSFLAHQMHSRWCKLQKLRPPAMETKNAVSLLWYRRFF